MQTEYYVVYELYKDTKNGVSLPDAYILRKISAEFQVSSDYILGLTDEIESKYLAQDDIDDVMKYALICIIKIIKCKLKKLTNGKVKQ